LLKCHANLAGAGRIMTTIQKQEQLALLFLRTALKKPEIVGIKAHGAHLLMNITAL
jgi:hypothetical protein